MTDKQIIDKVLGRLPDKLVEFLQKYNDIWLCGGFIRAIVAGEEPKDIDLFTSSTGQAIFYDAKLGQLFDRGPEGVHAFNYKNDLPIQLIFHWTAKDPQSIVDSFDFTMSKAALVYANNNWELLKHKLFVKHIEEKRLVYTSPVRDEFLGDSLLRAIKFSKKGWSISKRQIQKIIARMFNDLLGTCVKMSEIDSEDEILNKLVTTMSKAHGGS